MSTHTARLRSSGGPVSLVLALGDGVIAEWTVRLEGDGTATRTWTGNTRDHLPDQVDLPLEALPDGASLTWMAVFFGSHTTLQLHYGVKLLQDGKNTLASPIKGGGSVKARRTKVVSGTIELERAP